MNYGFDQNGCRKNEQLWRAPLDGGSRDGVYKACVQFILGLRRQFLHGGSAQLDRRVIQELRVHGRTAVPGAAVARTASGSVGARPLAGHSPGDDKSR